MSTRTRSKRGAAQQSAIVEISSDSDEGGSSSKRRKGDDDYNSENEAPNLKRLKVTRQKPLPPPAVPTAAKSKKSAAAPRARKTATQTDGTLSSIEQLDGCTSSREAEAGDSVSTASRMSIHGTRRPWNIYELLAENGQIDQRSSRNIVQLFENDNTIPFICRYRRDLISNTITPEKLREIKNTYTEIVNLRKRATTIVAQLEKENVLNDVIQNDMLCAKSTEELEFLYAPYKPASKGSLADRAKALGLEKYADHILLGESPPVQINELVQRNNPDLDSVDKVVDGICHIIAYNFSKNTDILEELRLLERTHRISLKCTKSKPSTKDKMPLASASSSNHGKPKNDESKFENYFNYENLVRYIKPHQVLAINRGEKSKFLSVKVVIPDLLKDDIQRFIRRMYMFEGVHYPLRADIFEKACEESYVKKLQPLLSRQIRSDLNDLAIKASIEVFAKNLRQLLLISPLKGERILGIDPGFTNGCKLALISETADVLETGVINPHSRFGDPDASGQKLRDIMYRNRCKYIALGNGTACRETEFWLSKLLDQGVLDPDTIRYSIISEQGASIYSCSDVAKKEFPNLDMNLISAASIARRLNDPLSEYVKIEPRHIGVGMYQHDINEKVLSESLNEVVSECVSFVGVDINTASLSVLKHIAGLTEKRAEKIIEHRLANGPFTKREDLIKVKSIGEKTFLQCAGFIRIEPKSLGRDVPNLLDCTWVHPESYTVAKTIIKNCKLKLSDIGSSEFISIIKNFAQLSANVDKIVTEYKIPKERVEVVLEGLQRELFKDYRSDFNKEPLFKQGISKITDLTVGSSVTGAVTNITHFGAFVDIGVESDGLIHTSKMSGMILNIGDRVEATVTEVDVKRHRIQLRLDV